MSKFVRFFFLHTKSYLIELGRKERKFLLHFIVISREMNKQTNKKKKKKQEISKCELLYRISYFLKLNLCALQKKNKFILNPIQLHYWCYQLYLIICSRMYCKYFFSFYATVYFVSTLANDVCKNIFEIILQSEYNLENFI